MSTIQCRLPEDEESEVEVVVVDVVVAAVLKEKLMREVNEQERVKGLFFILLGELGNLRFNVVEGFRS